MIHGIRFYDKHGNLTKEWTNEEANKHFYREVLSDEPPDPHMLHLGRARRQPALRSGVCRVCGVAFETRSVRMKYCKIKVCIRARSNERDRLRRAAKKKEQLQLTA